jgi:drug/metabolite transporter (DMT)-like permease
MSERLSAAQIVLLIGYAAAMVGGQLLFKLAAGRAPADGALGERLFGLLNVYLVLAVVLYAALSLLWVWLLTFTPLSRAYPFVALAFALTPLFGIVLFGEPFSTKLAIGIALILCGLLFVAG